jgi:hypothetical protein
MKYLIICKYSYGNEIQNIPYFDPFTNKLYKSEKDIAEKVCFMLNCQSTNDNESYIIIECEK